VNVTTLPKHTMEVYRGRRSKSLLGTRWRLVVSSMSGHFSEKQLPLITWEVGWAAESV
jgi:hypothetical protein